MELELDNKLMPFLSVFKQQEAEPLSTFKIHSPVFICPYSGYQALLDVKSIHQWTFLFI